MSDVVRMRFLADMNLSPFTVRILSRAGYDVTRVNSVLSANASDEEILAVSRDGEYTLITQDMDFSVLLAVNGYERPSVISLRLSFSDPETVAARLLHVLPRCLQSLHDGCVVSVEDQAIRIRHLPIR